jgi:perosamine synthetase
MSIEMAGPWITELEESIVLDALKNGWYGKDAYTYCELFQDKFAEYHDRKYAIMTPSCTTAIHLLLTGLGIKDGDEVIAPDCTWIGSVAGIKYLRAEPVFVDIKHDTWCIDPKSVIEAITDNTKAIIAVNLYGNMCDMKELQDICDKNNIYLIEDAAESLGSTLNGVKSGKFGIGSVFSFHRTKTITTGEGGMLLLDDDELYERCKFLRDHGRKPGTYYNTEVTYKYMPFNMQAALGYAQFKRLNELVNKKNWILKKYKERLQKHDGFYLNIEDSSGFNGAWCTTLVIDPMYNITSKEILEATKNTEIPLRPFFFPLTSLPAFSEYKSQGKNNKVAYDISSRGINLPSALNIHAQDIDTVCDYVESTILNRNKGLVNE